MSLGPDSPCTASAGLVFRLACLCFPVQRSDSLDTQDPRCQSKGAQPICVLTGLHQPQVQLGRLDHRSHDRPQLSELVNVCRQRTLA